MRSVIPAILLCLSVSAIGQTTSMEPFVVTASRPCLHLCLRHTMTTIQIPRPKLDMPAMAAPQPDVSTILSKTAIELPPPAKKG